MYITYMKKVCELIFYKYMICKLLNVSYINQTYIILVMRKINIYTPRLWLRVKNTQKYLYHYMLISYEKSSVPI